MKAKVLSLFACLMVAGMAGLKAEEPVVFYVPFDGTAHAQIAGGEKTPRLEGSIKYVDGIKGKAAVVGGKHRIIFDASGNLDSAQGTVSLWVSPLNWEPKTANFVFFVSFLAGTSQDMLLYKKFSSTELLLLERNTVNASSVVETQIPFWQKGSWYHLVVAWDKHVQTLYIDGEKAGEKPRIGTVPPYKQILLGIAYPSWAYLGEELTAMDELEIVNRRLSDAEILTRYKAFAPMAKKEPTMNKTFVQKEEPTMDTSKNLALKDNGAWIITSSFGNYDTLYEDNLIDGKADTMWQPFENEYPQYLELRWQYPIKADMVLFSGDGIKSASVQAWDRASSTWRKIKEFSANEISSRRASFSEIKTDRLRFIIESGEKVSLSSLEVYGPEQALVGKNMPYWDAWYVWYPEPDQVHKGNQPRYFRKTFVLEDMSFESAYLQARANDYYRIWINGKEAHTGSTTIAPTKVTNLLKKGTNVITAESDLVRNPGQWGWGEFLAELSINYKGESRRIGTDPSWKSSDKKQDGWHTVEFDDSAWKESALYVRPPEGPWGKIPYYSTAVREKISVAKVTVTPQALTPGEMATIEVVLQQPETPLKRDYFYVFELGEEGVDPSRHGDYIVSREVVDSASVKRLPGGMLSVRCELPLPPYTPSGKVPLRIKAYDLTSGIELDFKGIEHNEIAQLAIPARNERGHSTGKAEIAYTDGQASFVVDGQVTTPFFRHHVESNEPERLYSGRKYSGMDIFHTMQKGANLIAPEKDFDNIDQRVRSELSVSPDSRIVLEFDMRVSIDWLRENPEERLINAFGEPDVVSYGSEKHLQLCINYLDNVIKFLKTKPYWDKIIGFQPFTCGATDSALGGVVGNVWQTDRGKITVGDFNPQAMAIFREFLRKKYNNDAVALKKAWKKPDVTFENAMPDINELVAEGKDGNIFRDPSEGLMTFDYAEFLPTLLGNTYRKLAHFIKEETNWEKMVFIHYGFIIAHMGGYNSPGSGLNNNNYDLSTMLKDSAIDGYINAPSYNYRLAGTPEVTYCVWSSYRLNERMYLPDDDHRYYVAGTTTYGRLHSLRETRAIIRRNLGAYITRNFGSWFSDMSSGNGRSGVSWIAEKEVAELLGEMNTVYKKAIETGYTSAAETAVIFSPESNKYLDVFHGPTLNNNLITWMFYPEFFKLGAPIDVYQAEDLTNPKIPDYKLYVMMNTFYLTDAQREAVEKLKKDGKTILWFYAPGYVSNAGLSAEGIAKMTGIHVEQLPGKEQMDATVVPSAHPLVAGLSEGHRLFAQGFTVPATVKMHPTEFGPRFRISDSQADIIATFADGKGAMAARDFGTWKSVYSVVPRMDAKFLKNVMRWAGVHIYTDDDAVVFDANRNFIVLHNGYEKEKEVTLNLPRKTDVYDAITNERLATGTENLKVKLEKADTRVLFLK